MEKKHPSWTIAIIVALGGGALFFVKDIVLEMVKSRLKALGYIDDPSLALDRLVAFLLTQPWLLPTLGLSAVVLILWLALRWVTQFDSSTEAQALRALPPDRLQDLGVQMRRVAERIRNNQGGFRNPFPQNIAPLRGQIDALFARARSHGIYTPDDTVFSVATGYDILYEYFTFVGSHLKHGNKDAAVQRALQTKLKLEN